MLRGRNWKLQTWQFNARVYYCDNYKTGQRLREIKEKKTADWTIWNKTQGP